MKEIDSCLRQVAKLRAVAREEEVAYVARSRLGRLVLDVAEVVGRISNLRTVDRPARLTVPINASVEVRVLVETCNSMIDTAKTLVQPSEPLDKRWKKGWSSLMADLDRIEHQLRAIRASRLVNQRD